MKDHASIFGSRPFSIPINIKHTESMSNLFVQTCRDIFSSAKTLSGSQWADKYRLMGRSSRYRNWDTLRTPYLREIADTISDTSRNSRVVVIAKCAQAGGSEVALNEILRRMHQDPCVIMYFAETGEKVRMWKQDRLNPALMNKPFERRDTTTNKPNVDFVGGTLLMSGSHSPAGLSSTTAKLVIGDEVARYPVSIGDEGDFLSLARGRIKTHGDQGKIVLISTFTQDVAGEGTFYTYWDIGDRKEYYVPCPKCGEYWLWDLDSLTLEGMKHTCEYVTRDGDERYNCVLHGKWISTAERKMSDVTSYRINGFIIHPEWKKWSEFLELHAMCHAGRTAFSTFYNVELGQPFSVEKAMVPQVDAVKIKTTSLNYKSESLPSSKVICITAAIDVQKQYMRYEVRAWCSNLDSFGLEYGTMETDILNIRMAISDIRDLLVKDYSGMKIWLCGIDCAYKPSAVYEVLRYFPSHRHAIRGTRGSLLAVRGSSKSVNDRLVLSLPHGIQKGLRRMYRRHAVLGTDVAKHELYSMLSSNYTEDDGTSKFYCPSDYPDAYFDELVSETLVEKMDKKTNSKTYVFQKTQKRNEALDLAVYNRAMFEVLRSSMKASVFES